MLLHKLQRRFLLAASDPFSDIQLFLRVVELGSLRSAAREAGQEASTVSRRMTALERRLNTQLLERGQGQTRLSETGTRYFEAMQHLLPQLRAAEMEAAGEGDAVKGLLRVSAPIDFGQQQVAAWLLKLRQLHPGLDIELTLSSDFVDLSRSGIDVAIRTGVLEDSSLRARRLAMVPRVLVASPAYLSSRGKPESPEQLSAHEMVFYSAAHRQRPLSLYGPDGQRHEVLTSGGTTINAVTCIVQAVEDGAGIHAGPRWAFQRSLDLGRVVEVLPQYQGRALPMQALYQAAVVVPGRIRRFIDFAVEQAAQVPGLDPA